MSKRQYCALNSRNRSKEANDRISKARMGVNNPMWKGDNVGHAAVHDWVKNHLAKSALCQICDIKPPYDLANISGKYLRDLNDWQWLCRKCHMVSDGRLFQLKPYYSCSTIVLVK